MLYLSSVSNKKPQCFFTGTLFLIVIVDRVQGSIRM